MPLEDIGRLILEKRTKLGLGIRAAARAVGISHATLARVEKGFLPDLGELRENPPMARSSAGNCHDTDRERWHTASPLPSREDGYARNCRGARPHDSLQHKPRGQRATHETAEWLPFGVVLKLGARMRRAAIDATSNCRPLRLSTRAFWRNTWASLFGPRPRYPTSILKMFIT